MTKAPARNNPSASSRPAGNVRPVFVGVAGGSCAGKSTLVSYLAAQWASDCAVLNQDSYYHDLGLPPDASGQAAANFDHPDAIDFQSLAQDLDSLACGRPIDVPVYDFTTHRRTGHHMSLASASIVLLDGTLILTQPLLLERLTHTIFIRCPREERLRRRLQRDQAERGRTASSIHAQFESQVEPMHMAYVEPSQAHASLIIEQADLSQTMRGESTTLVDRCRALIEGRG